ncbi:sodium:proton antiporter [Methanosarcina sp. DH1]|uniref:cation:proton antiporter n=1 Tax=Methanosarcina sp. DH1 TaxID=2605695 RepID=UPI001E63CC61|nr:sodium:proton antiporter [Methanosarcina sp. DH1]MCC4767532.1 sodium:proton antiporter [Methanosarcina sp. DH1]
MTSEIEYFVIAFAVLLFLFGLVSRRISGTVVTAPMIFVTAGMLLSPEGLDLLSFSSSSTPVLSVAELALVLTLFSDASKIELQTLLSEEKLPGRLLIIGTPLTIAFGAIVAAFLLKDITLAEAGLIGAMLSPTDAGLGQAIVNNTKVPAKIRQALNVESGLNDGGAIPFFLFFLILARGEALKWPVGTFIVLAFEQIGIGVLVGAAIGLAGGWLSSKAVRVGWMAGLYRKIGFMSLAVISWLGADLIGGSGFIAAFTGGLITQAAGKIKATEEEIILTEAEGSILSFAVFFIFGITAAARIFSISWPIFIYAVFSLTLIRMIPVAISLIGMKLHTKTVLFLGWFGPRGLASVVLLLIAMEETGGIGGSETLSLAVITTVFLSVFVQGATAGPGSEWYSRIVAALPTDAPERKKVGETSTSSDNLDHQT